MQLKSKFPAVFTLYFLSLYFFSAVSFAEQSVTETGTQLNTCPVNTITPIKVKQKIADVDGITILSKSSSIVRNELAYFSGDVTLVNKDQRINAQQLEFNRLKESFSATGDIHYQADSIDVFAHSINANNEQQATILANSSYQLANNPAHGSADNLTISAKGDLTLQESSFTTCQQAQPDWLLEASKIYISTRKNRGEAYNAKLKLFGVPVFYIPYFSFPVTNERKSGLLYPQIGSSNRSGLKIATPYYINIANNMDATITPKYMSKRGLQLVTQFRYLSGLQAGEIDFEYLNKDLNVDNNKVARYLARIQHTGTFAENFRLYTDYTTISDDNYLVDIESKHYNSNDAYLYQVGELSYFASNWQTSIKLQDFEVLGDHVQSYQTIPQITFNRMQSLPYLGSSFDIYSEFSRFDTQDINLPTANRYHIEAGFNIPFSKPAWFLNSEFKVLQTYYQQDRLIENSKLDKHISRTLPKVRLHAGINLDRKLSYFDNNLTQTLEPQIQYLYITDKDQSNIGIYDTTPLQDDYNGLFRAQRYSGLDRIAAANQFSLGLTSRILSTSNQEIFRLSVGKILYLNDSNPINKNTQNNSSASASQSALAGDMFYQINNKWQVSGDIQYDTKLGVTNKSQANIDYQYTKNHLIQLNHRFSRGVTDNTIEQVSLLMSGKINKDWQFVTRFTQDLANRRSIETYAGLQYESCCWALRFAYHRNINSKVDEQALLNQPNNEFDSGFMLQFVIKGLGGQQSSVGIEDMFNSSIFGYKRPYFLNN